MFYDNFLAACARADVKPTAVIVEAGLSSGNISKWKKGVVPSGEIILKLAKMLRVSTDALLDGLDAPEDADAQNRPAPVIGDGPSQVSINLATKIDLLSEQSRRELENYIAYLESRDEQ
ncbi:MAG: hypothetical protein PHS57_06070 [Alphaproteobacteria bacterium]|nr:hypothetical protein [Alphaproteobacteria bacterium]